MSGSAERSIRRHAPKILLVDDDATQLKLNRLRLEQAGYEVNVATGADEALQKTNIDVPDAIVSDVFMGEVDGFALCRKVREDARLTAVPVILLSAHCDGLEDQALSVRVGACELLTRTAKFEAELAAIAASLEQHPVARPDVDGSDIYEQMLRRNASRVTKLIAQVQSANERYRALFEHANDAIAFLSPNGVILEANRRWQALLGIDPSEMVGRHIRDYSAEGAGAASTDDIFHTVAGVPGRSRAVPLRHADGHVVTMEFALSMTDIAGQPTILSIGRDVTEAVAARQAVTTAEERYRTLVERMPDVVWTLTVDRELMFLTPNVVNILGYTAEEIFLQNASQRDATVHPDEYERVLDALRACAESGTAFDLEYRMRHKKGHFVWVRNRSIGAYERDGVRYIEGMISDINDRKILEESFYQAQRMEAIGQLTGGIAHDFNNILAAILANSHFLIEDLAVGDARRQDAEEIRLAAERAASLTRQLLAFSRRQVLEPAIVDLNTTVSGIERMLCRLIGEDIRLVMAPAPNLGAVRVDVGQIEQVLMNLVVNARDAMPTGGTLTVETTNVEVDGEYVATHAPVERGRYVVLTVSDTGSGMNAETKRRLFEPFFTTKELGKGTGLGLSTCYGIVKQSGGHIWVYSEPGLGTVFKIYLPRVDGPVDRPSLRQPTTRLSGSETVLVVEDDPGVRSALTRMLAGHGYRVLQATDGVEAAALLEGDEMRIDLLLTDVVMPRSSGPEIAALVRQRCGSKVLFMSGYNEHSALSSGGIERGQGFLQKPFSPQSLAKKVREVLDV